MTSSCLLLACLLASVSLSVCQSVPPAISEVTDDRMIRIDLTTMSSTTVECPDSPGFIGVSDRRNSRFVSRARSFGVDLAYRRGDLADMRRVRDQKLGAYHCLYRQSDGDVTAYAVVLSELRPEFLKSWAEVGTNDKQVLTCVGNWKSNARVVWDRYNQTTGLYDVQPVSLSKVEYNFTALQKDHFAGFTSYRCYPPNEPEKIQHFGITYAPRKYLRTMTRSNYTSTLIPQKLSYNAGISLECEGSHQTIPAGMSFNRVYHRRNGTYVKVKENDAGYEYQIKKKMILLDIEELTEDFDGIYKCKKDGILHLINITLNYGLPELDKTGSLKMQEENTAICKASISVAYPLLYYIVERPGKPNITLRNGSDIDGFQVKYNPENKLELKFAKRQDMVDGKVICLIQDKHVDVTYWIAHYSLSLRGQSMSSKFVLRCDKNIEFGNLINFTINCVNSNGTSKRVTTLSAEMSQKVWEVADINEYFECICIAKAGKRMIRSNVVSHGEMPASLDIVINEDRNPVAKAIVAGRDVEILCHFRSLPATKTPTAAGVSLLKDAGRMSLKAVSVDSRTFRFVLKSAGREETGNYTCAYDDATVLRSGAALTGSYRSPTTALSICDSTQFVCDMKCLDRSKLCDKNADCKDGSDEAPENCNKCEPNEVSCLKYNGTEPSKKCVLKHWLCDSSDDCGNGYDEDKTLHRKWCVVSDDCKCQPGYTCCPSNSSICIRRDYECDKESDCPGGGDESNCDAKPCIRIIEPTQPKIYNVKVGEPFNLTCVATGNDRPTVNWRRNWAAIPAGVNESLAVLSRDTAGVYTVRGKMSVTSVTMAMAGIYNCEAVNNCGRLLSVEMELRVSS